MRYICTLILLTAFYCSSAQTAPDSLFTQLKQANFGHVYLAKEKIVNQGKEAIPALIELLKDTSFVKLQNTADLIYPGAEKFYGHGWIVNYDIDWLSVRAAWLLEEITFNNFGYRGVSIDEKQLMKLHQSNYASYLKTGSHEIDYKNKTPQQQLVLYRSMLADSVANWWSKNKDSWSRIDALKDALSSTDIQRQGLALHFLRFEETKCDGLTREKYEAELKPLVIKIRDSKNDEAEQAKYLLDDKEYYWLKIKLEKNGN